MNMPELSAFEQALTNFIGDWEDDEERWPSKFVKKHGKHILDMAREELQKEQKPAEWSRDDENALKYLHELIGFGYSEKFMDAQTAADMREWVNVHLHPDTFQNGNSHWTPSEEQMKALQWWSELPSCSPGLKSLYEDLKKLI